MREVNVRAARSFYHGGRGYTRGRHYMVDMSDPVMVALVKGKFLTPEAGYVVDLDGTGGVPDTGVVLGGEGPAQAREGTQVNDGQDQVESSSDHPDGTASGATGAKDGPAGAAGGNTAGTTR